MEHKQDRQRTYRFFDDKIHKIGKRLREVSFPGFQGVPIYDVFWFFINGLQKGVLNTRASSIAFNFLLSLGPTVIFIFSLLRYIPIRNFRSEMLEVVVNVIPETSFNIIQNQMGELQQHGLGITTFGLLTSLFFAQKAIHGITEAFNATYHTIESRQWYKQRLVSITLVFVFYSLTIMALTMNIYNKLLIQHLVDKGFIEINTRYYLILAAKWLVLLMLTFVIISTMYYFCPSRKTKWRFFSAGSSLATILVIITSFCFTYFMNHFAQLNKFFGSIGALMALMLWMNINSLTLLIGFELNASINNAQLKQKELT